MPGLDAPSLLAIQQRTIQTAARVFIYAMGLETCYEEAPHNKPIASHMRRSDCNLPLRCVSACPNFNTP